MTQIAVWLILLLCAGYVLVQLAAFFLCALHTKRQKWKAANLAAGVNNGASPTPRKRGGVCERCMGVLAAR